jgi:hypothetical protein
MKKYFLFGLTVALLAILLPYPSFAAKVSVKNVLITTVDPSKQKCTLVPTPNNNPNNEVEVDDNIAHQPLVEYATIHGNIYYSCPVESFNKIIEASNDLNFIQKTGILIINFLLGILDILSEFLLDFFGKLVLSMIKQSSFINHTIVKNGWPFIQGVANLGFIFVLLYIALATTLRMESVGTSIQRLLPKLLIGALLVNFSLVVGGLLIDTSRVIMAAEIRLMGGAELTADNFTGKLLKSSHLIESQIASWKSQTPTLQRSFWVTVLRLAQGSLFRVLMALAFGVVALNLFVRYIALLVLLIFSPIPYLTFVLPKTQWVADQWWGHFLKWVFYGPIVLFFLVIITQIQNIEVNVGTTTTATGFDSSAFKEFVRFLIVISLFFVANHFGKKVAGIGSDAVMSFAKKNPRTAIFAGMAASGGLLPALGFLAKSGAVSYAASAAANSGRDFYRDTASNIKKRARATELFGKDTLLSKGAKILAGPARDKEGNRKLGEDNSFGSWAADQFPWSTSTEGKAAIKAVVDLKIAKVDLPNWSSKESVDKYDAEVKDKITPEQIKKLQESSDISPSKLMKKATANALPKDLVNLIMQHGTNEQRIALVTHKEVVKKMSDGIKGGVAIGAIGKDDKSGAIKKKMDSRLQALDKD